MESILDSIKKILGISDSDNSFDHDIITFINMAFMNLNQIGVGPLYGFSIEDRSAHWSDYSDDVDIDSIKTYVYLKVRLLFDPPASSTIVDCINRSISELEWRLNNKFDNGG